MSENDLPPIKNYPAWLWRIFRKIFVVTVFGIGSLIIGAIVFPVLRIFNRDKLSFKRAGHKFISLSLEFFIHLMSWVRISTFKINDLKAMRDLRGCVIVANHPSLLDVVYLFAFVRDANCIVKAGLKKSLVSLIVRAIYISNNVDFEIMQKDCVQALHNGGNLIIFPEGTRTPRHGTNQYKKGAARIRRQRPAPAYRRQRQVRPWQGRILALREPHRALQVRVHRPAANPAVQLRRPQRVHRRQAPDG